MTLAKILAALTLLIAPAAVGVASVTDTLPGFGADAASEENPWGGEIVETFEKDFDTALTDGSLDLRVDRGVVHVEAWDENGYKVLVLQEEQQAQTSDYETEVTFEDASEGSTLDLKVLADRQGTYSIAQEDNGARIGTSAVDLAIVAFVPASVHYELVHVCSGQQDFYNELVNQVLDPLGQTGESQESHSACVPAQADPSAGGAISLNTDGERGLNVTFLVKGLTGEQLDASAVNAAIGLQDLAFEKLRAGSNNGAIDAEGIQATKARLGSNNGEITFEGTAQTASFGSNNGEIDVTGAIEDLSASSNNGAVEVNLVPQSSGTLHLSSNNGAIEVHVPQDDAVGYAVQAASNNGDIDIDLQGANVEDESSEYNPQEQKSARTQGFEDKAVQVAMQLSTNNGDIEVTDDGNGGEDEEEAEEGSTDPASALQGTVLDRR